MTTPIQKKIDCTDKPLLLVKMNDEAANDSDSSDGSGRLGQELMDGRIKEKSKNKYGKAYNQLIIYLRDKFLMKVTEGKAQITFDGYKTIAQKAILTEIQITDSVDG